MESKFSSIINLKTLMFYFIFFVLLYYENTVVLNIPISVIWKLLFLIYGIIFIIRNNLFNGFLIVALIVSLKMIFHANFPLGFIMDSSEAVFFLALPIAILYFKHKYRNNTDFLKLLLIKISCFYIISSVPFILGILESRGGNLDYMGFDGNKLIGVFEAVAISSKVYALSTVVILFYYREFNGKVNKLLFFLLITFGSIATFQTLGRIGWAILISGFIYIFYSNKGKSIFVIALVSLCSITLLTVNFINFELKSIQNNIYYLKLTGTTKHKQNYTDLDLNILSSGRGDLFKNSVKNFSAQSFLYKLYGYGKKRSAELMLKSRGSSASAHNRFLEILEFSGVIGLFFFLIFIKKLSKYVFLRKTYYDLILLKFFFYIYVFTMIPSHGLSIYSNLLFAILIAFYINKNKQIYEISE
tara:strand:+ start:2521 stop:3765 length:1245 start_codon:yes stop_codon:yes gene_type:complete